MFKLVKFRIFFLATNINTQSNSGAIIESLIIYFQKYLEEVVYSLNKTKVQ